MNDLFTEAEKEHFEERSAIIEHDGGESREKAEAAARQEVIWERERFRSMVRQLIKWVKHGEKHRAYEWLNGVASKGRDAKAYEDAAIDQMQKGNKGEHGVWIDQ